MTTLVVSIICIAMIVTGGVMLTQGMLSAADTTAVNVADICVRESEFSRTGITMSGAEFLSWSDLVRVTVYNSGQVKLSSFDDWDVFATYNDAENMMVNTWLPRTNDVPRGNEWQLAGIGLNGPVDFFEPGILNPGEQGVFLAGLYPGANANTTGTIAITCPNGVSNVASFLNPGYALLLPHAENVTLASTKYYACTAFPGDSDGMIIGTTFSPGETGRHVLLNDGTPSREGRFLFSLAGISEIPAGTWSFGYRCMVDGDSVFPGADNGVRFNADINVYAANGTLRQSIAAGVAAADFPPEMQGTWTTLNGSYEFPGYTVVESTDYLEIVYYGDVSVGPDGEYGSLYLQIDDSTLPLSDQTRIKA